MTAEVLKPPEVLELHDVCGRVFDVLQVAFDVPSAFTFDLSDVDQLVDRRIEDRETAAFAMRGMQVLRSWASPSRPMDGQQFVAMARRASLVLEKLLRLVSEGEHRGVLLEAHNQLWAATWAVIRDGGLDPESCQFR